MAKTNETLSLFGLFCLSAAAFGNVIFGYHVGIISGALLFLSQVFQLTVFEEGMLVSILLLGGLFGALLAGMIADRFGRKRALLFTAWLCLMGTSVILSSEGYIHLFIGRLLIGFGVGIVTVASPLYLAEVAPAHHRGRCVSIAQLSIAIGIILAYGANFLFAEAKAWKPLFFIGIFFSILQLFSLFFIKETPSWFIAHNKNSQAAEALKALRKDTLWQQEFPLQKKIEAGSWKMFKDFSYVLWIGTFLSIFQQITGINAVLYYTPKIFQEVGMISTFTIFLATLGIGTVNLLSTLFSSWTLDKIGRRPLLLWGTLGMFLSLSLLSYTFLIKTGETNNILAFVSLILYVSCFSLGLGPVVGVVISEIYPLNIRGKAIAIAVGWNWLANYAVSLFFPHMLQKIGGAGVFGLFAFFSLISLLFVYRFIPEAKGKSLEEIETMVKSKKF
jgi:sugar porter (SP) family MFS transporter